MKQWERHPKRKGHSRLSADAADLLQQAISLEWAQTYERWVETVELLQRVTDKGPDYAKSVDGRARDLWRRLTWLSELATSLPGRVVPNRLLESVTAIMLSLSDMKYGYPLPGEQP